MAAVTEANGEIKRLDRYGNYVSIAGAALLVGGIVALVAILFGGRVLPPAIEIIPERMRPFSGASCPGDSIRRTVTHVINRPVVLEISTTIYDLDRNHTLPESTISESRPAPYTVRQTIPFTFTTPSLPPGRYEFQTAVTAKGQNSVTAWQFLNFEIKEGCEPMEQPTD